jgi:polyisoprenyl-phosphate glycosyltransferase
MIQTLDFQPATATAATASGSLQSQAIPEISVVIPTYGAEQCLRALHSRLTAVLSGLVSQRYEIVFIEDCSPDRSWSVLQEISAGDERVRICRLSRNFGQQMAITAGLSRARGNWIVVMDCDLQDPPEEIPRLYAEALNGHQIVLARRQERKHSAFRRWTNQAYFGLLSWFSGVQMSGQHGSFSIIARAVRDAFMQFSEGNRHYLLILFWLGFDWVSIDYEHGQRYAGKSSYNLVTLLKHAVSGIFFQTTVLLRLILTLGFGVSAVAVLVAIWTVVQYFMHGALPGWSSLTVLVLGLGGCILVCQGITGLYIGEVFNEVKRRPLFLIAQEHCSAADKI